MRLIRAILVAAVLHGVFTVTLPLLIVKLTGVEAVREPFTGIASTLGFGFVLAGVVVYTWAAAELLLRTDAAPVPLARPHRLQTTGIYAKVRNPLLIGVIIILLGEATWFKSVPTLGYAAIYWVWLHLFVVRVEEPDLQRRFGPRYSSYQVRVPRWLPRIRRLERDPSEGGQTCAST